MKRLYLILAFLLLILVVLGFLIFGGHDYRRDLEAYKKDLIAHGEKLTVLEALQPLDTNDPASGKKFTNFMSSISVATNLMTGMKIGTPGRAVVQHAQFGPADMNGYESNQANVAALRSILGDTRLHFSLDYSLGFIMPLPHLAKLKSAEMLAGGTALQALHSGDYSEAYQDLRTSIDLVRNFPNDQILISELVRIALAQIALRPTWELLQEKQWSDSQLALLQTNWQKIEFLDAASQCLRVERASGIGEVALYRKQPNGAALLTALFGTSSSTGGGNTFGDWRDKAKEWWNNYPRFWHWKKSWSYEEELYFLKISSIFIQCADQQRQSNSFRPLFAQMNRELASFETASNFNTDHMYFLDIETPAITKYISKVGIAQTLVGLTSTAIAFERYHLAHNQYPERLDQLVPAFLEKIPTDFMDGKPLRYSLHKDGTFLLYSVGEDGVDDGGDASGGMPDWTKGVDIVWPTAVTTNAPVSNN